MKAIVAMSKNRVIGNAGTIPWHLSEDLKFFKKMTSGSTMIMGRKTFESLPSTMKIGDRKLIVLTKQGWSTVSGQLKFVSYPCPLPVDSWVCGGAEVYRELLPLCTDLYLTRVLKDYEGDTFFPSFDHLFIQKEVVERNDDFMIIHYVRRAQEAIT